MKKRMFILVVGTSYKLAPARAMDEDVVPHFEMIKPEAVTDN